MSHRTDGLLSVLSVVAAVLAGSLTSLPALDAAAGEISDQHAEHGAADPHGGHQPAAQAPIRSSAYYGVPAIRLVRDDGKSVTLADELNDGRPVALNFIYTSCSGICPLASHIFSQLQRKLGDERDRVHLVSISIDPEEDTPARLREYAHRYAAGSGWQHYTGTVAATVAAQRAFDVYKGDKMGHTPVTLVRTAPGAPWVRFDGFATADVLMQELLPQTRVTAAASSAGQ
jgi:protein SCO1